MKIAALIALALAGAALGAVEPVNPDISARVAWQFGAGIGVVAILLFATRGLRATLPHAGWVVVASFVLTVALAFGVAATWPNSGDEYGYLYIAETLLAGRTWNPPAPSAELFRFNWIFERNGHRFSQYPPGWSAMLAPFVWARVPQLANPVLTLALGTALLGSLRRLAVPGQAITALAMLVLLSPFVLFNGASYFAHTASAAEVMALCWLQLRDEARQHWANRAAIGVVFSLLLSTRYEVCAIMALVYIPDRVWHRRSQFAHDALPMLGGALPGLALMLAYDHAITGSAITTPFGWANPQLGLGLHAIGNEGAPPPWNALKHGLRWLGELAEFAGFCLPLAFLVALAVKFRRRSLRFFDLTFPACVAFFAFYPDFGGHQYGPRYWLFAWPTIALTIGSALVDADSRLPLFAWHPHLPGLALLQLTSFAATTMVLAIFLHAYIAARRMVYDAVPPATPALVLFPTRLLVLGPWQAMPYREVHTDLTRNGMAFDAPVLYGRGGDAELEALGCTVPNRLVYAWEEPGVLREISCPAPTPSTPSQK